jgi:anti-sigma regulatory factor (Ser/Thr protein kinase)
MRPNGGVPADSPHGFVHRALIYGSEREFIDGALPFIEEGVDSGEAILVAVQAANLVALRDALGPEPAGVRFLSVDEWYENSARTRDKFEDWVAENAQGGRVRLIGEPPWAVDHEAQVRDWARHESVLNIAFDRLPASLMCPYDAHALPAEVIEHAACTHPEIMRGEGEPSASPQFEDPRDFCARLAPDGEEREGAPSAELSFGLEDLRSVRRLVEWEGLYSGLPEERIEELILAVNEVAGNALVHGGPPASLRIWNEGGEIVFEIVDAGAGISDALAGQLRPDPEVLGGRGLWLSRMMADAVEIHSDTAGSSVTIHATLPGAFVAQ